MRDDFFRHPPGILKEISAHIRQRAFLLQPEHAVTAALSLAATVLGRRFCSESGLQTNLFLLSVGPYSTGKRRSMRTVGEILDAAGLDHMLIGGELANREALVARVAQKLNILLQYNSLTMVIELLGLNSVDKKTADIVSELIFLYDNATRNLNPVAEDKIHRDVIQNPYVNVHSSMTGDRLSVALKSSPETAQFLSRFLIVDTSTCSKQHQRLDRQRSAISTQILDWIRSVTGDDRAVSREYAPLQVTKTSEAAQLFDRFRIDITGKVPITLGSVTISPWAHAYAHADKIATICACADNPIQPYVTEQHAMLAIGFVRYYAELFECRLTFESSHSLCWSRLPWSELN